MVERVPGDPPTGRRKDDFVLSYPTAMGRSLAADRASGGVMRVDELVQTAKDAATVRRVFGEPVVDGGVTVIPAAHVVGGAGGGSGTDGKGQGEGGGWGVQARPAGAYVIKNGQVSWRPAVDVNRVIAVAGAVAAIYLLVRQRGTPTRRFW